MSDTIIKLENISKQYRLGQVGVRVAERSRSQTLRGDLQSPGLSGAEVWWHTLRGKEDPTLKIGQTNKLETPASASLSHRNSKLQTSNSKLETDYVWALRDINLEVKQGEILYIIGKNAAILSITMSEIKGNFDKMKWV